MFLRGFDYEIRCLLADQMRARGIDLRFERDVVHIGRADEGALRVELNDDSQLEVDQVLYAIGRVPNTQGLDLEDVGVDLSCDGAVMVDSQSRTCVDSVYAIGDCTDRMNLTPVAIAEAHALVRTIFENIPTAMDYRNIATAVFGSPPLAAVGLTESEARDDLEAVDVYHSTFRPLKYTLAERDEKTLMKLIVDARTDRVVGAHMLGPDAAEIVQAVAVAVRAGLTKKDFDDTVAIHPTAAEEFVTMRTKG
jgi:glutathione reductase (NADPH)